jgi:predicted 3-demethylubiquinone-9 3-methyltransferase (glyoxalase superfamily)
MQKIVPYLWFDTQAEEAAKLYVSAFPHSKIGDISRYTEAGPRPAGTVLTVQFELDGLHFAALNGGPELRFNPSISFLAACRTKEEVERLWGKLSAGGMTLMELGAYPFSEAYGWTQDKYGASWQIMLVPDRDRRPAITPTLMFVGSQAGEAEEAIRTYTSIFRDSKVGEILRYAKGEEPDKEGTVKRAAFTLEGQAFAAMDSAHDHNFTFNEAISLLVDCEDQAEIDHFWQRLTQGGDPAAQQCGWLKDRFGLSWQIVPAVLGELMSDANKANRVMTALLPMKKLDVEVLRQAAQD